MDYSQFKEEWKRQAVQKQLALFEQMYGSDKIYWHASDEILKRFDTAGSKDYYSRPVYVARSVRFYFQDNPKFNILRAGQGRLYMHAVKFRESVDIFDPNNTKDIEKVTQKVFSFIENLSDEEQIKNYKLIWNGYLQTGYWRYIEYEHNKSQLVPNRILYKILRDEFKYDGFIANTSQSLGSMGVFDPNKLVIARVFTKEEFKQRYYNPDIFSGEESLPYAIDQEIFKNIDSQLYEDMRQQWLWQQGIFEEWNNKPAII